MRGEPDWQWSSIFVRSPANVFLGLNKTIVTLIIIVRSYELFLPPHNTNVHLIIIVRSGRNVIFILHQPNGNLSLADSPIA